MTDVLRAATRGSRLARLQTELVADALGLDVQPVVIETLGDRRQDMPLSRIGGQGVFVKEVQQAVLDGRADIAVHSAKDLTSQPTPGLVIAAVPERDDPRDALVGSTIEDLPVGACVGTGSVRRRAQLASLRPDLTFGDLRGNIETRLAKASSFDAVVVAMAALRRLGLAHHATQVLDAELVVPQVGQGALAVECREDDERARDALAAIDDPPSRAAVDAERAFLATFGIGCDLPVGAYAVVNGGGVVLDGLIATGDGRVVLRASESGDDPAFVGRTLALRLLRDAGGESLLEDLR